MDDNGNKKPEDETAEPARDVAQEEGAKLRKVSEADLNQILAAHEMWLETREQKSDEEGKQADLSRTDLQGAYLATANLQGAILFMANLQGANLFGANFQGANLFGANLQGANLREADLQGANLREASLQNADLSDAKLSDVTGLLADKLAGANLSNAKIPEDIAAFIPMARAEKISRNCRAIFIGILTGCAYSLLTVATTTDARLLTNSASSPLPIIGTEVPIAHFYVAAPLILLFVYFYFQLYLQRLWTGLADLPAFSPDGRPLDKRLYPWLMNGLVRAHFKLLKDKRTFLQRVENWATVFLAWWIVPLTLMLFWGRYLPRHEWFGTALHIVLLTISIASAILLHRHAAATLRKDVTAFRWRRPWSDRRTYQGAVAVGLGAVFALVSLGAIEGEVRQDSPGGPLVLGDVATWVPYAFDRMGYRTYANLREADVSTKPATWTGLAERLPEELDKTLVEKARAEFAQVKGAPLQGADLRHADAYRAFLAKADLYRAKLQGAYLEDANLQGANLTDADLQEADLFGAKLQGARLGDANLGGADLIFANLQGADLQGAHLQEAYLTSANLQGANLFGAKLQGAYLGDANLGGANLFYADLQGAYLGSANLQEANLGSANLQGARLIGADLRGADLTEAWNLTREQLDAACGDDKTTLPDYLADYQMKPCPTPEQPPED